MTEANRREEPSGQNAVPAVEEKTEQNAKEALLGRERILELVDSAKQARLRSYSPYSHYQVGAALLTEQGEIITGCNMENASFSPGICAERTAVYKAVSEGMREFLAIAIVGGAEDGRLVWTAPCGVCRQVLMEFCQPDRFLVVLGTEGEDYQLYWLEELLPMGFGPKNLGK